MVQRRARSAFLGLCEPVTRGVRPLGLAHAQGRAVVAAMLEASAKTPEQLAEEENEQRGPYYWEDEELTLASPAPLKMWHNMCWAGEKVFEGAQARTARLAAPWPRLPERARRGVAPHPPPPLPQASSCWERSSSTSLG